MTKILVGLVLGAAVVIALVRVVDAVHPVCAFEQEG